MVLALLIASCGQDDSTEAAPDTVLNTGTVPIDQGGPVSLPALAPAERMPTTDDPLRVVLAGDSFMGNLASALEPVLDDGDLTDADFRLFTVLPRGAADEVLWQNMLEEDDPDLIVMLVGGWEDQRAYEIDGQLGSPTWQRNYREQVVEPFTDIATSTGAELLWVGFPPVGNPRATTTHIRMNQVFEQVAADAPGVVYIDSGPFLFSGDGTAYTETIDEGGGPVRLRSNDSHLCPEGVVRLAEPLLAMIEGAWSIDVDDDWADGEWRYADLLPDPATCDL